MPSLVLFGTTDRRYQIMVTHVERPWERERERVFAERRALRLAERAKREQALRLAVLRAS
jgi:hypothetical protein